MADSTANFLLTPYRKSFGTIVKTSQDGLDFEVEKVSLVAKVAFGFLSIFATLPGLVAYGISRFNENPQIQNLYKYYSVRNAMEPWLNEQDEAARAKIKKEVYNRVSQQTRILSFSEMNVSTVPVIDHPFFTSLEQLDLSKNRIAALPETLNFPNLSILDLKKNEVSDISRGFAGLKDHCRVDLNRNRLTKEQVEEFNSNNPKEIVLDCVVAPAQSTDSSPKAEKAKDSPLSNFKKFLEDLIP